MTKDHIEPDPVLIAMPVPIVTPRLVLRPVQPGDGAALAEAAEETWDDLYRWMLWSREGKGPDHFEKVVRRAHARYILREDFFLAGLERETGRAVLWTGLHEFCWETRTFEIGYWVRKSAQGRGYATESAHALIRYAFGALAARRVEIDHAGGNERSRRVIEKLGFRREGVLEKKALMPDGRYEDSWRYARMNADGLPPLDVRWGEP